tara:strand:+ start:608 stop:1246 length:639 start_codon:yes stop_codon:yes gene_type:complete
MKVELIDKLGTDLTVINAARVSFDKHHEKFTDGDENLIKYLASHRHWTPFGHPQLQFRITAPIFVARQLVKHQIGLVWNEVSRRYVESKPQFYLTEEWRNKAENKKQGSGKEIVELTPEEWSYIDNAYEWANNAYSMLLKRGVAPEQARMMLPQATYTEWYWTGSLHAFSRVCNLRLTDDAQEETREVAKKISNIIKEKFPVSWKYLVEENN